MPESPAKKTSSTGLAIYGEYLYFVELDPEGQQVQKLTVKLPEGCISGNSIADFTLLAEGFTQIHKAAGNIREPVNIGIPSGDAAIRILTLPRMSLDDIRGTLDLNFEEYFPFSRLDAVFDVLDVRMPVSYDDRDEIPILAAAVRRNTVERILDCAREAGFEVNAIEPVQFAMIRAIPEAKSGLGVYADPQSIIATWDGGGIMFRNENNTESVQGIMNTVQFLGTQYRGKRVDTLMIHGLDIQLNRDSGVEFVSIEEPFFTAEGLALRDRPDTAKIDLRPMEYVELEKRRHSLSLVKILAAALLLAFFGTSIWTIYYGITQTEDLKARIIQVREANREFIQRRAELTQANSKLEQQRRTAERILNFFKGNIPALEVMNALEANSGEGVKFTDADFVMGNNGEVTVTVNGSATEENLVMVLSEGLKRSRVFENVTVPISRRDFRGGMIFRLVLKVRETV